MTETLTECVPTEAPVTASLARTENLPEAPAPATDTAAEPSSPRQRRARRRSQTAAPASPAADPAVPSAPQPPPLLQTLAGLYPELFGKHLRPLKRGIFHDLLAAHPETLERDALKQALGLHTRSTLYLMAVAAGEPRRDLQGQVVEPMAPEHVYQALLEVFRRRHRRTGADLRDALRQRMLQAFEASGLSREAYAQLMHSRDEAANALLDLALAEAATLAAKDEALLRAFEASGQASAGFAGMYGIDVQVAEQTLARARRRRSMAVV